ncbi:MAG: YkgJ family cysteine cluster protein [Spirochaetia bacterium]|nr:YkgJ family cysteine cluster protein [Spirochaetia bacterium]
MAEKKEENNTEEVFHAEVVNPDEFLNPEEIVGSVNFNAEEILKPEEIEVVPEEIEVVEAERLSFPYDEERMNWLKLLLDSYQRMDTGVDLGIRLEAEKRGKKLACHKGCSSCCITHGEIPVYPLELVGITWYVTEKTGGEKRKKIRESLEKHQPGDPCPFLLDHECSIHPMRPLACRQFNVFNKVCEEGEDAYYTRPEDVLRPLKTYIQDAFNFTLPFYGVTDEEQRLIILETGKHHKMAQPMQNMNWKTLIEKMDAWDLSKN